jgi:hypothetical protein
MLQYKNHLMSASIHVYQSDNRECNNPTHDGGALEVRLPDLDEVRSLLGAQEPVVQVSLGVAVTRCV